MIIQISSGQGPVECEIAVRLLFESLEKEFCGGAQGSGASCAFEQTGVIGKSKGSGTSGAFKILNVNKSKWCDGYASIVFSTECDLSYLEGSVEWQCESFMRPGHKRKNWFIDVTILPDCEQELAGSKIQWQFFRCGGNGGQNVNKVETGVRLIHEQTGITVTCTEERSQALNRKRALEKLNDLLEKEKAAGRSKAKSDLWMASKRLVRGNPVRVYMGKEFLMKE